jgi:hypothetical protein
MTRQTHGGGGGVGIGPYYNNMTAKHPSEIESYSDKIISCN